MISHNAPPSAAVAKMLMNKYVVFSKINAEKFQKVKLFYIGSNEEKITQY